MCTCSLEKKSKMATRRCIARTRDGNRCRLKAAPDSRYCFVHTRAADVEGPPPAKMRKGSPATGPSHVWLRAAPFKYPVLPNIKELMKEDGQNVAPGTVILLDGIVYSVIRQIGAGGFGVVFAVESGGNRYALKIGTSPMQTEQELCAEADMQKRFAAILLKTPTVYKCSKFYYADAMYMYIVMELMQGSCDNLLSEMLDRIGRSIGGEEDRRNAITAFAHVLYIYREMIRQVNRLEFHGVYHVDIKPGNMLYSYEKDHAGGDILRVCLSDYGAACDMSARYKCYPCATVYPPEWAVRDFSDPYADHFIYSRDEMKRAQWYMMGSQFSKTIKLITDKKTIGGMHTYDFLKMVSPGDQVFHLMLHLGRMSYPVPSERQDVCKEVIRICDAIVQHCLPLAPGVSILLNSMMPYTRKI